jgi:hypothetical protein
MAKKYFDKFPTILYDGFRVRNLTVAAKVVDRYTNLPYNYYRYELDAEQRADTVASQYYGDQYMSWTIYYANKTVDPYYGWFLSEENFNSLVEEKHGSIEEAHTRIEEFRSNWFADDRELSPSNYTAMFGEYKAPHNKYWAPNYSEDTDRIVSYSRKRSDNVVNTNKIVRVGVSNNATEKFTSGDLIDIKPAPNGSTAATAEVVGANSTSITFKNLIGEAIANGYVIALDSNSLVYSTISNYTTANNLSANTWTLTNIPDEEYVYWTPYTSYDIARERNDSLKNIKLIDPATAIRVADSIEKELSE